MIAKIDGASLNVSIYSNEVGELFNRGFLEAITSPESRHSVLVRFLLRAFESYPRSYFFMKEEASRHFRIPKADKHPYQIVERLRIRYPHSGRLGDITETFLVRQYILEMDSRAFREEADLREKGRVNEPGIFEHLRGISFDCSLDRVWVNYYAGIDGFNITERLNPLVYNKNARKDYAPLFVRTKR